MKTIAWDVDDVLNDLMRVWFEQKWSKDHPDCNIRYKDIIENPPHRLLNTALVSYLKSLDEFRLSPNYLRMSPIKEVLEWFREHGNKFRHIALTAVPLSAAHVSAQWVFKHFSPWVRTFHFVPSKRGGEAIPEYDNNKGDFLKWLGKADIFIDDTPSNLEFAKKAGIKTIMFPRPWNQSKLTVGESLAELEKALK